MHNHSIVCHLIRIEDCDDASSLLVPAFSLPPRQVNGKSSSNRGDLPGWTRTGDAGGRVREHGGIGNRSVSAAVVKL